MKDGICPELKLRKANFYVRPGEEEGKPILLKIHRHTDVESSPDSLRGDKNLGLKGNCS